MSPSRRVAVATACVLLGVALVPSVVLGTDVGVDDVSFGDGAVAVRDDVRYVWQTAVVDVVVDGHPATAYEVCLRAGDPGGPTRDLDCVRVRTGGDGRDAATLDPGGWAGASGERSAAVVVRSADGPPLSSRPLAVFVLARDGDLDGDGLTNARELDGDVADFLDADTDDDGLADGFELDVYGSSPRTADTDDDGLADGAEVETHRTDPTVADTDGDGLADGPEVDRHDTDPNRADTDGDGLTDMSEVAALGTAPTSPDTDGDGLADASEVETHRTDPTVADTDGDGLEDGPEVDTHRTNPTAADTDGDGLEDGREVEAGTDPAAVDTDGDGTGDAAEVGQFRPRPLLPAALSGLVVLAVLSGLVVVARRRGDRSGAAGVVGAARTRLSGRGTDHASEAPDGAAVDTDRTDPTGGGAAANGGARTDEERVLALLRERGGRVRQSTVVEATDWSKAKVSRLLSSMADEGQVRKVNVGRGNVIELPDDEGGDADVPADGRTED